MTPDRLTALLETAPVELPSLHDPALRPTLEALADASPADSKIRDLTLTVHGWLTAGMGLAPIIAGVKRTELIRWDAWSTTWLGMSTRTGSAAMVRTLRPGATHDPMLRRALHRDGEALSRVLRGLRHIDTPTPALILPLPYPAYLPSSRGGMVDALALARLVGHTLGELTKWADAGLAPIAPADQELRDGADGLYFACLTPAPAEELPERIGLVAEHILTWWDDAAEHPLADLLEAFVSLHPPEPLEAAERATQAMASELADTRWSLERRARSVHRASRHIRLADAVQRLHVAVPPPSGRGVMGVNMDGEALLAVSERGTVTFGPEGAMETVLDESGTLHVAPARHMVRSRASAPLSRQLNQDHGGTVDSAEALARWTSARLDLRTIRRLLALADTP